MAKWIKQLALTGVASVLFLFCGPAIASACMVPKTFDVRNIDVAGVVFRGRVETYEELPEEPGTAKLRFVVDETFRGPKEILAWDVVWQNSTFGIPEGLSEFTASYGRDFIVGLVNSGAPIWMSAVSYQAPKVHKEHPNLPWILQAPCSPPFMFGVSEGHVTWILFGDWVDGGAKVEEALRDRKMLD